MPTADYDLAATGRAIAEPARAAMLLRLLDGQAHGARDLAEAAGVSPSSASPHLRHLVEAGLVSVTVSGRRKLHSLASPDVATALEALAAISPLLPVESLRQARAGSRLQRARVCYSHLGGALAVSLADELVTGGAVEPLTPGRVGVLRTLEHPLLAALAIGDLPPGTGPAVRGCLDWTERGAHLAGRLGSAVLTAVLGAGWLTRRPRDRSLTLTADGANRLADLGVVVPADGRQAPRDDQSEQDSAVLRDPASGRGRSC
ncbi:helix-turn-helix transcriptional regulator [Amycolatopsis minnesotensis]|uniref:Winged helix-turn-helix domain-containing protein n=1 Tax=Amycolatopsis minnesotensis TaxID=337894 RepID=A0ABN2PZL0_9PSEU